ITPRLDLCDSTDSADMLDSTDANDAHEPIENAEHADPIEPIDANEPADPMENDHPVDAIEQNELRDQSDQPVRRVRDMSAISFARPSPTPLLRSRHASTTVRARYPVARVRPASPPCCPRETRSKHRMTCLRKVTLQPLEGYT